MSENNCNIVVYCNILILVYMDPSCAIAIVKSSMAAISFPKSGNNN